MTNTQNATSGSPVFLRTCYLLTEPNFDKPEAKDHVFHARVWSAREISADWKFQHVLEGNLTLNERESAKNLKPAELEAAGFPARPSGVNAVTGVNQRQTRHSSTQLQYEFTATTKVGELSAGPRLVVNFSNTSLTKTDEPKASPPPAFNCENTGDIYCGAGQREPVFDPAPKARSTAFSNQVANVRLGGILSYKISSWLDVAADSYLQAPLYGAGTTVFNVRPTAKATFKLDESFFLVGEYRLVASYDLSPTAKDPLTLGQNVFLGLGVSFR